LKIEEWKSQIRRGVLEYCILLLFSQNDRYGYEIMGELSKYPIIAAKESTTYPLLRRLETEHYLRSYWQETTEGLPPRKYYSMTEVGKEYIKQISLEWENLITAIDNLKGV
jgi:PadR family transcriptional regulator PadR